MKKHFFFFFAIKENKNIELLLAEIRKNKFFVLRRDVLFQHERTRIYSSDWCHWPLKVLQNSLIKVTVALGSEIANDNVLIKKSCYMS